VLHPEVFKNPHLPPKISAAFPKFIVGLYFVAKCRTVRTIPIIINYMAVMGVHCALPVKSYRPTVYEYDSAGL